MCLYKPFLCVTWFKINLYLTLGGRVTFFFYTSFRITVAAFNYFRISVLRPFLFLILLVFLSSSLAHLFLSVSISFYFLSLVLNL